MLAILPARGRTRRGLGAAALFLSMLFTSGCGGSDAADSDVQSASLRFPFLMAGYDAPLVLADSGGYFEKHGVDMTLAEGKGSPVTAQLVANGREDFGLVDVAAILPLIAEGAPIEVVAVFQQVGSSSFVSHEGAEIASVKDLVGKTIIHDGSGPYSLLPAVLEKNSDGEVSLNDLSFQTVQAASYQQSFLSEKNAVLLSNIYSTYQAIKLEEPGALATTYADLGVNVLGLGLITNSDTLSENPELVRSVVAASVEAWQAAEADPEVAIDAAAEAYPDVDREAMTAQLAQILKMIHTPASQGKVIGWSAEEDWQSTIDILQQYAGLAGNLEVSEVYTNEFLPSE